MENIWTYNNAQAFTSFEADIEMFPGMGSYCFTIHGVVYHKISTLKVHSSVLPAFGQLYIIDTDEANNSRLSHTANRGMKCDTLEVLLSCSKKLRKPMH